MALIMALDFNRFVGVSTPAQPNEHVLREIGGTWEVALEKNGKQLI